MLDYLVNDLTHTLTKDIDLLDKETYQALIYSKNNTQQPYANDKTVVQLFEQQAQKILITLLLFSIKTNYLMNYSINKQTN